MRTTDNSYAMVEKDCEGAFSEGLHHSVTKENFIWKNFRNSKSPALKTNSTPLRDQLKRDSDNDPALTPATTFGVIQSTYVDETCYIRPKYIRFAPCKGSLESLKELLCEKWLMKPPSLLINVFGSYKPGNSECLEKVREIVKFGRQSNAWFMASKFTDPMVAYCNREEAQKSSSSDKNIVFWEPWTNLLKEEQALLTPSTEKDINIHSTEWEFNSKDCSEMKLMARQSACFIFTDYTSKDMSSEVGDYLFLIEEFAKTFDEDGHKDACRNLKINVCPVLNIFINEVNGDEERGDFSLKGAYLAHQLLKSQRPTLVVYKGLGSTFLDSLCQFMIDLSTREVRKKDIDHSYDSDDDSDSNSDSGDDDVDNNHGFGKFDQETFDAVRSELEELRSIMDKDKIPKVANWITKPELEDELMPQIEEDYKRSKRNFHVGFFDLTLGIRDFLVESRKDGLDLDEQKLLRKPEYTQLYLSMKFNLTEECERILSSSESDGVKESFVSILYFYKRFDLLDYCIKKNYNIRTCLYNSGKCDKYEMLLARSKNSITRQLVEMAEKNKDSDALEGIVYSFINTLLGKETSSVPGADPCHLSLDDVMFVFYCFNEEWEMADIMRRYSDYPIFKCFIAISAMQNIKRIRNSSATADYFDVQSIDSLISNLDGEAGRMLEWSYINSLDIGPVLFWEHPQYAYKSIMDLADETQCYAVLEDKTNAHSYITTRWNGAIDTSTCWIAILLSWISLGFLAPFIIQFDLKQSKKDEYSLFLHERKKERSYLEKFTSFWNSPRSKCYLLMITYLVFLLLLTILILDNTRLHSDTFSDVTKRSDDVTKKSDDVARLSLLINTCLAFVICFLAAELDFTQVTRYNIRSKLRGYFLSNQYNLVDLFSAFTFLIYCALTLPPIEEKVFLTAKLFVSVSYIGYIVRFTQFLQLFEATGPKLISIRRMFTDLVFFAAFLLLTIFAYGIVSEFLLHPYPRSVPASQISEILKRPYVNMFGELDLDNLEAGIGQGICKYEMYLNGQEIDDSACEEYACDETCKNFQLVARILLGLYTMTTVILLTNLLVSIFGKTYETDFDQTRQVWQLQRYKLVKEAESQCFLPFPPFNLLYSIYKLVKCCSHSARLADKPYYEQYVKEVEYRCSRKVDPEI